MKTQNKINNGKAKHRYVDNCIVKYRIGRQLIWVTFDGGDITNMTHERFNDLFQIISK